MCDIRLVHNEEADENTVRFNSDTEATRDCTSTVPHVLDLVMLHRLRGEVESLVILLVYGILINDSGAARSGNDVDRTCWRNRDRDDVYAVYTWLDITDDNLQAIRH